MAVISRCILNGKRNPVQQQQQVLQLDKYLEESSRCSSKSKGEKIALSISTENTELNCVYVMA